MKESPFSSVSTFSPSLNCIATDLARIETNSLKILKKTSLVVLSASSPLAIFSIFDPDTKNSGQQRWCTMKKANSCRCSVSSPPRTFAMYPSSSRMLHSSGKRSTSTLVKTAWKSSLSSLSISSSTMSSMSNTSSQSDSRAASDMYAAVASSESRLPPGLLSLTGDSLMDASDDSTDAPLGLVRDADLFCGPEACEFSARLSFRLSSRRVWRSVKVRSCRSSFSTRTPCLSFSPRCTMSTAD